MRYVSLWGASAILALLASLTLSQAEDTRKKWQFGAGFSYWSTDDNIRSNSTTAFAPKDFTQSGLPSVVYFDPRPDANELNEPTIQDNFKVDFHASFGVSRWFALELGASYFKGDVGNIEFFSIDRTVPVSLTQVPADVNNAEQPRDPNDPTKSACADGAVPGDGQVICYQMKPNSETNVTRNGFLPVGKITEVPVSLSGLVRFRPESPFDPYIGGGLGYIFTSLDTSTSRVSTPFEMTASDANGSNRFVRMRGFDDVQAYTNGLNVADIRSGPRGTLTFPPLGTVNATGKAISPLVASVEDGPEYHLMGGVDYYFNDHLSLYIDGRYLWARSRVKIRIDGEDQISASVLDIGCKNGGATCSTTSGPKDTSGAYILGSTTDDVKDLILIQGGDIRLGGFSLGIGAKITF